MDYPTQAQQTNPYADKLNEALQQGASRAVQQIRDRQPIEVAMEAMEKAMAGIDATIAALDGRLSLVKRGVVAMSADNRKESNEPSNNSPLVAHMQKTTNRMNAAQRRIADICSAIEL